MEQTVSSAEEKPLWRKIVDFPLVAMLIAVGAVVIGLVLSYLITANLMPRIPALGFDGVLDLVGIPIILVIYKLFIVRLGRRPRDELPLEGSVRLLSYGLLGGFLIFSLIVAVAALLGVYSITGGGDLSGLSRALVAMAIFPGVSEEILFRGVLFRWLEEFGGSWLALLLTSSFFGAAHLMNPGASPIAAVGIAFEAGVMLGAAYMLTRSLWLPIGLHAAWNFTQGEIYDIPVSGLPVHGVVNAKLCCNPLLTGNGFGLEASLIAMVVATLFGIWLLWLAVRKGELVQPMWVRRRRRADAEA
jgi:membrane protease YdiL (CAAX protease family)